MTGPSPSPRTDDIVSADGACAPTAAVLGESTLALLNIVVPRYDRSDLRQSIVHMGVGGFHRAHLATYVDELCAAGHQEWAIVGAGVMSFDVKMAQVLDAQDHLYTLITRDSANGVPVADVQVIGSITNFILATEDRRPLINAIAADDTQIVSLTVTEGGYPVDDQTGLHLPDSPNAGPGSAFGVIVEGLNERRRKGGAPITIMSCDNIMSNGKVARAATLGEAARYEAELTSWIESSVSFPNSMVDRITPATADSDRKWLEATHQIIDQWPVVTEPFRQWVIEDNFAGDRLPLEELDVIVTDDVEPYEFMKLRLLNAGHSCLAYLAALDGIETVDVAMADPSIRRFLNAFLHQEAKVVLPDVAGIDIDAYIASLIVRFSNAAIGDQISRLCLDGSAKFPKFLMPTVQAQVAADGPVALAALALAGWCQYLGGTDDHGQPITLSADPVLEEAVAAAQQSVERPEAFLDFDAVFTEDVRTSPTFVAAFSASLQELRSNGMRSAISAVLPTD